MFVNHGRRRRGDFLNGYYRLALFALCAVVFELCLTSSIAQGQNNSFSSGSSGIDGEFAPTISQTIVVPDSGIFNFTTVNIPAGISITFSKGTNNLPLTILATGDVVIAGTINVDGKPGNANGTGGAGGPGGFDGGSGGYGFDQSFSGVSGDGPGGGGGGIGNSTTTLAGAGGGGGFGTAGASGTNNIAALTGPGGPKFGTVTILPLIGGSGGGGGGAVNNARGGPGGGGGGAILIASSGTITLSGAVISRGGPGIVIGPSSGGGAGGAGGAIRLVANTIHGNGALNVSGGTGGCFQTCGGAGGQGYVRVEAYDTNGFTGPTTPSNIASFSFPHPITTPNAPVLRIASVGGVNAPTSPLGSLQSVPDVIVPATQLNPVTVALEAANIPVGTIVQVTLTPSRGTRTTVLSSELAGTETASSATANLNLPGGISVITALVVIDLIIAKANPTFMDGERVNRIEVAATLGSPSELTYVTSSGRRLKRSAN